MFETVATDFVPLSGDVLDQPRVALRYPSQDEERGLDLMGGEQIQQELRARFHSRGQGGPLASSDVRLDFTGVKVLFDVNTQHVDHSERTPYPRRSFFNRNTAT